MDKKGLSKRAKARIVLYLSAVILVLGIFSIVQTVKANKYELETLITRQMALISLDEYLNNISTNLEKTIYANTPAMLSKLSTEMWREASSAKNSLSMLPTGDSSLDNTYKFLSQIGEFVMSLQRKTASGEELTSNERNQLRQLYDYCNSLNEQVQKMCYDLENGNFSFESTNSTLLKRDDNISTISGSFDDVEQSISDLPSLIYDGPFSDHIEQGEAKFIKGLDEITKDQGLEIAKNVCSDADLQYSSDENGNIPCYIYQS
ncbi:MAG: germination protein YpeB, partial [Clostridia bacterium]|nr:germination protein YpeB [Clostridia bacterium]